MLEEERTPFEHRLIEDLKKITSVDALKQTITDILTNLVGVQADIAAAEIRIRGLEQQLAGESGAGDYETIDDHKQLVSIAVELLADFGAACEELQTLQKLEQHLNSQLKARNEQTQAAEMQDSDVVEQDETLPGLVESIVAASKTREEALFQESLKPGHENKPHNLE